MKIAIVTGASSGMGKQFCYALDNLEKFVSKKKVIKFDEIWVIARRKELLENLKQELKTNVRVIPLDLTKNESFDQLKEMLETEKPNI